MASPVTQAPTWASQHRSVTARITIEEWDRMAILAAGENTTRSALATKIIRDYIASLR